MHTPESTYGAVAIWLFFTAVVSDVTTGVAAPISTSNALLAAARCNPHIARVTPIATPYGTPQPRPPTYTRLTA